MAERQSQDNEGIRARYQENTPPYDDNNDVDCMESVESVEEQSEIDCCEEDILRLLAIQQEYIQAVEEWVYNKTSPQQSQINRKESHSTSFSTNGTLKFKLEFKKQAKVPDNELGSSKMSYYKQEEDPSGLKFINSSNIKQQQNIDSLPKEEEEWSEISKFQPQLKKDIFSSRQNNIEVEDLNEHSINSQYEMSSFNDIEQDLSIDELKYAIIEETQPEISKSGHIPPPPKICFKIIYLPKQKKSPPKFDLSHGNIDHMSMEYLITDFLKPQIPNFPKIAQQLQFVNPPDLQSYLLIIYAQYDLSQIIIMCKQHKQVYKQGIFLLKQSQQYFYQAQHTFDLNETFEINPKKRIVGKNQLQAIEKFERYLTASTSCEVIKKLRQKYVQLIKEKEKILLQLDRTAKIGIF